jgi:hypothetical protein
MNILFILFVSIIIFHLILTKHSVLFIQSAAEPENPEDEESGGFKEPGGADEQQPCPGLELDRPLLLFHTLFAFLFFGIGYTYRKKHEVTAVITFISSYTSYYAEIVIRILRRRGYCGRKRNRIHGIETTPPN